MAGPGLGTDVIHPLTPVDAFGDNTDLIDFATAIAVSNPADPMRQEGVARQC